MSDQRWSPNLKRVAVRMQCLDGATAHFRGHLQASMRQRTNNYYDRKPAKTNSNKILLKCHFVHLDSHTKSNGIGPDITRWKTNSKPSDWWPVLILSSHLSLDPTRYIIFGFSNDNFICITCITQELHKLQPYSLNHHNNIYPTVINFPAPLNEVLLKNHSVA